MKYILQTDNETTKFDYTIQKENTGVRVKYDGTALHTSSNGHQRDYERFVETWGVIIRKRHQNGPGWSNQDDVAGEFGEERNVGRMR